MHAEEMHAAEMHAAETHAAEMLHQEAALRFFPISCCLRCKAILACCCSCQGCLMPLALADAITATTAGLDATWLLRLLLLSATATTAIPAHGANRATAMVYTAAAATANMTAQLPLLLLLSLLLQLLLQHVRTHICWWCRFCEAALAAATAVVMEPMLQLLMLLPPL